jgi:hypothetical protein
VIQVSVAASAYKKQSSKFRIYYDKKTRISKNLVSHGEIFLISPESGPRAPRQPVAKPNPKNEVVAENEALPTEMYALHLLFLGGGYESFDI